LTDVQNDERELAAIRRLFPITQRFAYLRNGSVAPLSLPVVAAMHECISILQNSSGADQFVWHERFHEVRAMAARLIGADPSEIAFVRNTSHGMLIVSNGIPWRDGDNVVSTEGEYPVVVSPFVSLRRIGVETRLAPSHHGRIEVDAIADLIDERTRVVALSFVGYWTGFRHDLAAVGELCRDRGVYLCVDAIQGLGALRLDVRDCHIDFLSVGGHKWLLGPTGTGIFYCRRELIDQLIPALTCSHRTIDGDYFNPPLASDATRFETGVLNLPGLYGLGASLGMILDLGPEWIEGRVRRLTDYLIAGLQTRGYNLVSPVASWEERSGIVTFNHADSEKFDSPAVRERLSEAKVVVSQSGVPTPPFSGSKPRAIKVAPHYYNTEEDIDRLLAVLM